MKLSHLVELSAFAMSNMNISPMIFEAGNKSESGFPLGCDRDKDGVFTDSKGRKYKKHKNGQITKI